MPVQKSAELARRPFEWLVGGGAMGGLVRTFDWEQTLLGPLSAWPQSLRNTVNACLNSRLPILVWWGAEQVAIYNDAYQPMLGSRHPRSLGQRGRDGWPEVWDVLGPKLERVASGGPATWLENQLVMLEREGLVRECYFTFSYSPIRHESGSVDGVSCAVTETTAHVLGERRSRTLSAIAQRAADATSLDEACRLAINAIADNAADLPFALLYVADEPTRAARLVAATGVAGADGLAGDEHRLGARGDWPLDFVLSCGSAQIVDGEDFQRGLGALRSRDVAPPKSALLIPFALTDAGAAGVLVVGLSGTLAADEQYRSFLGAVAGEVATVLALALGIETADKRSAELAEVDRAKMAFFSNVSHEFRTPLTLMIGPTEDALAAPERALRGPALEIVYRNELRLLKLVNTLLDFARIEAGRSDAAFEATDLAALTRDVATTFQGAFERAGLGFEVHCDPAEQEVYVDRDMWEKIVLNLLSNAFKFTFDGGVVVTLRSAEGRAVFSVRDSGVGIPAAELPRVFERFFRSEGARSRSYEGSGIGLSLVRDLTHLHGGEIVAERRPGGGTTFTVSVPTGKAHLPAERIRAGRELSPSARPGKSFVSEALSWLPDVLLADALPLAGGDEAPALATRSDAHIIVADDNADMRDYLGRLLGQHWQVRVAADGAQALLLARANVPDLVLTDVMMPNLDGFGLIRALRDDPRTASVPVVMLSARVGEEPHAAGLAAGANDYLVKPFSAKELVARVAIHLELGRLRRAADTERQRFYSLFEEAPAGIAVLRGPKHVFELANARYEQILRRTGLVGRSIIEALPELDGQAIVRILDRVYTTGKRYVGHELLVRLSQIPGGESDDAYFDFVYEPFHASDGTVDGVTCVALDVSARVRGNIERDRLLAERESLLAREREARREAEQASRAKDEFLAMLGHELRNPLAPIVTALQLLRMRGNDPAEREHTIIERQVNHLTTLVDDLLDISRITQGKLELKLERVELLAIVTRAIEMASPLLELRRHVLTVDVPSHGLALRVDPTRFAQAVSNLVTNAAKYTEEGGQIFVSAQANGGELSLNVRDNGIGIAAQTLPHVFDIFMQERQASDRAHGGLGLGLAIVRNLVEMHGGTVSASSGGLGAGSSFTIRMPAAPLQERPEPVLEVARAPLPSGRVRRVLIVDDNTDAAELLALTMGEFGCETRVAYDGPAALTLLESFRAELALMDIGLPVMDGYELARLIRARSAGERIRLVAVTGYGQKSDIEQSRAAGFDEHLTKPVDIAQLKALVFEAPVLGLRR